MRIPVISNIRGLALLVLLPTSLTVCHAQRQWTLDECISYAIEHNINIQQRELDIKKSQVKLSLILPELSRQRPFLIALVWVFSLALIPCVV